MTDTNIACNFRLSWFIDVEIYLCLQVKLLNKNARTFARVYEKILYDHEWKDLRIYNEKSWFLDFNFRNLRCAQILIFEWCIQRLITEHVYFFTRCISSERVYFFIRCISSERDLLYCMVDPYFKIWTVENSIFQIFRILNEEPSISCYYIATTCIFFNYIF